MKNFSPFLKVLECLLEVRNKPLTEKPLRSSAPSASSTPAEMAFRELDRYNAMTEREKSDFNLSGDGVFRSTTESPMSPTAAMPPAKKKSPSSGKRMHFFS